MNGPKLFSNLVLRPLSDLGTMAWMEERRTEFLWRERFDRYLQPGLFSVVQALLNTTRPNEHLALVEERRLPDEDRYVQEIIDEIGEFIRGTWLPGSAQRFGNTKTFGVVRGTFTVLPGLPRQFRHGIFAEPRSYRAWIRFSGPGPYTPPDMEDWGQCSIGIKLMGVPGPKLMDDEQHTQDFTLVSPASFVTPNVRENAKLQRYVRDKTSIWYFFNPFDHHLLAAILQWLCSPVQSSPLETRYYSDVPYLLGPNQAVQYSLKPGSSTRTKIPSSPSPNYLREAMVNTLDQGPWSFDFMVQRQTDAFRMPIEDATVKWPERLSPYIPVAKIKIPSQTFDSDEQINFASRLRYNPWHSLEAHKPLGNQNRARYRMYLELAKLRQEMNQVVHVEPTGDEAFPGSVPLSLPKYQARAS